MTKTRVRVGMLGAGFIGQMHSLAFRGAGYSRAEPSVSPELVVLADHDQKAAADVADRYDWSATTTDWRDLLDHDLDLFVNAGPNDLHLEASVAAAKAGLPVFCEKPLASSADEAHRLWKSVASHGRHEPMCLHAPVHPRPAAGPRDGSSRRARRGAALPLHLCPGHARPRR